MAGDVRYCKNCRRDIASANYVIHSVHCERNIVLCSKCNEPVPRTELPNHEEEFHGLHTCELCGQEMEGFQMADHRETCRRRPVSCKFCDLECPFEEAEEHQIHCGARTEKCRICNAYIKLTDQEAHRATCKQEHHARQLSTCEHCLVKMPTSLYQQHVSLCERRSENSFRSFDPVHSSDNNRHEGKVEFIPCEYCDTSIPSDHFVEHISVCGLQYKNCLKCNASFMLKDRDTHFCQSPHKSSGRCAVCQASVPWVDLREHEAACRLAACSSEEEEELKPTFQQKRHLQRDPRPLKKTQETTYQTMRQCPFCRERHPDLILEEHSQNCGSRPVNCEFCGRSLLLKDQPRHQKRECPRRHSSNYDYRDSENYLAGASGHTKEFEKRVKQCPYCDNKFAEIMFADHQESCQERPYQCDLCLKPMPMRSKAYHESTECLFKERFKKVYPGSETPTSEDAPMYKKSFERDYLEKNAQVCPYCKNKIPEAKIAEHVQFCAAGKKPCHFCGAEIPIDKEKAHMQECIANKEDSEYQTVGNKKGKKKNKKRNQNNPDQPKGWISSGISTARTFFSKKSSSPEKGEFVPEQYLNAQVVQLPCEFCEAMFPDFLLIEHESGCRPDLMSMPTAPNPKEHRLDPFHTNFSAQKEPRSTGALPKRNRFHRDSGEGTPGEFLPRQSPPKEKLDFYNYPSGIPDHRLTSGVLKQSKTTLQAQDKIPENKTANYRMEKSEPAKNSKTELFNFSSSSSNKSTSNQSKSPASTKYPEAQKTEPLKAVGAERAEKKGTIPIFRDTPVNFEVETADKYNENLEEPNNSRNSGFKSHSKMNPYSSKDLQQDLNIPFDEPSVAQHESIEPNCDAQLARLLSNPEYVDLTEDDAKNVETFGSHFDPGKPLSLSNDDGNFSDSLEFYDAEDNLKLPNMEKEGNLNSYIKFLTKDEDKRMAPNNNNKRSHASPKDKVVNCSCKNTICYCGVLANNNGSDTEYEGQQGRNPINGELSRLSAHKVTNYSPKESCDSNMEYQISAKIEKRSPAFTKWRSQNICNSDSD